VPGGIRYFPEFLYGTKLLWGRLAAGIVVALLLLWLFLDQLRYTLPIVADLHTKRADLV
jgi:hypothetical protein